MNTSTLTEIIRAVAIALRLPTDAAERMLQRISAAALEPGWSVLVTAPDDRTAEALRGPLEACGVALTRTDEGLTISGAHGATLLGRLVGHGAGIRGEALDALIRLMDEPNALVLGGFDAEVMRDLDATLARTYQPFLRIHHLKPWGGRLVVDLDRGQVRSAFDETLRRLEFEIAGLVFNLATRSVRLGDRELKLTRKRWDVLVALADRGPDGLVVAGPRRAFLQSIATALDETFGDAVALGEDAGKWTLTVPGARPAKASPWYLAGDVLWSPERRFKRKDEVFPSHRATLVFTALVINHGRSVKLVDVQRLLNVSREGSRRAVRDMRDEFRLRRDELDLARHFVRLRLSPPDLER